MTRKVILKDTNNEELIPYTSLATGAEAGRVRPDGSTIEVNASGVINVKQSGLTTKANVELDNLNSSGQMVIDSQNGTISNCILEIPQNLNMSIDNNVVTLKSGSTIVLTSSTYTTATINSDITGSIPTTEGRYILLATTYALIVNKIETVGSGTTLPASGEGTFLRFFKTDEYKWYNRGTIETEWTSSSVNYPVCCVDVDSNGVASFAKDSNGNNMIFNGMCYMGGYNNTPITMVVYPNIKALIPNGLNDDGTLKSISVTTNALSIFTRSSQGVNLCLCLQQNGLVLETLGKEYDYLSDVTNPTEFHMYYIKSENLYYRYLSGSYTVRPDVPILVFTKDASVITIHLLKNILVRLATTEMLDKKQDTIVGAASTITSNNLTANRALSTDTNGKVNASSVTTTELRHLSGVTSSVQTQLNGKANVSLNNLSSDGQMIIDSQNGTISNCVLEIPQNIKLTLENNVITLKSGSILTLTGETYQTSTTTADTTWNSFALLADGRYVIFTGATGNFGTPRLMSNITSGSSLPESATADSMFFNTTDKKIYRHDSGSWVAWGVAYPLAIVDIASGVASFAKFSDGRDCIFNGIGFVGQTKFIYPNVKVLQPIGKNADGTLKSKIYTTDSLQLSTSSGTYNRRMFLNNTAFQITANNWYYNEDENMYYDQNNNPMTGGVVYLGNCFTVNDIVTNFTIRQPIKLVSTEVTDVIQAQVTTNTTAIATKANDSDVVKLTGNQTIAGIKNFTDTVNVNNPNTNDYVLVQGRLKDTDITSNNPVNGHSDIRVLDKNNVFAGGFFYTAQSTGKKYVEMRVKKKDLSNISLELGEDASGNTYTSVPTPTEDTTSSNQIDTVGARNTKLQDYQTTLTFDSTPTASSTNPVTSGGVHSYIGNKFQVVNSLPETPDADTFYFIVES